MDLLVQQTAGAWISRLPAGVAHVTLQDLRDARFPEFLVRRIAVELENNLAESIVPPKSDWADMQAEPVIAAWEHFLYAIHEATRMPSVHARTVVETSVEDLLELLVEPRRRVVDYLFGRNRTLSLDELRERTGWLVVYQHLGTALLRWAEKKGLDTLTRDDASRVVKALDEKIVAGFTPLTWTQSLDEFFQLVGERAEPDVLARFFADRGRPRLAALVGRRNVPVSRTELVELLSLPSFDDDAAVSDDITITEPLPVVAEEMATGKSVETHDETIVASPEPALQSESLEDLGTQEEQVPAPEEIPAPEAIVEPAAPAVSDAFDENAESELMPPAEASLTEIEPEIIGVPVDQEAGLASEVESPEADAEVVEQANSPEMPVEEEVVYKVQPDVPVQKTVFAQAEPVPKAFDGPSMDKPGPSLHDSAAAVQESAVPLYERFKSPEPEELRPSTDQEEPLWKRFARPEEIAIINHTFPEPVDPHLLKRLKFHVSDKREDFLDSIFAGDADAMDEELQRIASFHEWSPAGKYIASEIFKRYKVDMYSELGIDFLDRIQSFFLERRG